MRELSAKEFKQISLGILEAIHSFCIKENIKYSLAYGTLLGAVRHKGFIPWDDDIDIVMPREDYDRFVKTFNGYNKHFAVLAPELDWNYHSSYAHVFDVSTKLVEDHSSYRGFDMGVKIDVFPLDGTPQTDADYKKHLKKVQLYNRVLACKRHYLKSYWPVSKVKFIIVALVRLASSFISYKTLQKKLNETARMYPFNESEYVDNIVFSTYYAKRHKRKDYSSYVLVPFEGREFMVVIGYDDVLSTIYGDYMKLPPVEKRVTHHNFKAWMK